MMRHVLLIFTALVIMPLAGLPAFAQGTADTALVRAALHELPRKSQGSSGCSRWVADSGK